MIGRNRKYLTKPLPQGWKAFRISGPLFFAAADLVFGELSLKLKEQQGAILVMDAGGVSAFTKLVSLAEKQGIHLLVTDLNFQPLKTLAKAKVQPLPGILSFYSTLSDVINSMPGQNIDPQDEAFGL